MSPEGIGVSTITLARTPNEEKQIVDSLKVLSKLNLPIVVCDGGSPADFLDQLKKIEGIIITPQPGGSLLNQVRESLNTAAAAFPYVFYTESNKLDFFSRQLLFFLDEANKIIKQSHPDVIVASRSPESFSTYPPFQKQTESITNLLLADFLETKIQDYSYGPRVIDSQLISSLNSIGTDLGWGWMSYILFAAKNNRQEIKSLEIDLPCPQNEREETAKDKRLRLKQLDDHIRAILEAHQSFML